MIWGPGLNKNKVSLKPGTKVLHEDATGVTATMVLHLTGQHMIQ